MNDDVEAKRLGEKLLLDVQVEGLSSVGLKSQRRSFLLKFDVAIDLCFSP